MSSTISQALVGATEELESEVSLAPAIDVIPEMADIELSRITLDSCIEKVLISDGSVVDVLEAEQTYKEWRAEHSTIATGRAQTGEPLLKEMQATLEMMNSPSMESDAIQMFKRTFNKVSLALKTFGRNLSDIRNKVNNSKGQLESSPALITSPVVYNFFTRSNKPVKLAPGSIDDDIKFINECENRYNEIFSLTTELGKRFREACNSDSNEAIRDAIEYFEGVIPERQEFAGLTKFHLLGNRGIDIDDKGFPHFTKNPAPWNLKEPGGILGLLARKKIHGFSVGGEPTSVPAIDGINGVVAKRQVKASLQASGGVVSADSFVKLLDKANVLNSKAMKFASMANTMGERIQRLSADMDDAWNHVNTEKSLEENSARVRELRALRVAARKSVATYMFMAKSLATMMEDHTSFVYRNVTILANEVLKKTGKVK